MRKTLVFLGWPVAFVLLAVAVQQWRHAAYQVARVAQMEQQLAAVGMAPSGSGQSDFRPQHVARAESPSGLGPEAPASGSPEIARVEGAAAPKEGSVASPDAEAHDSPLSALLSMVKSSLSKPGSAQARMMFESQYGELMDLLALDPERSAAVRTALTEELDRSLTRSTAFLAGDREEREKQLLENVQTPRRTARDDLRDLLTERELALYDDYHEGEAERGSRRQYGMQLGAFAPDLGPDARERVLRVLVEEDLAARERRSGATSLDHIAQLDRVVARLEQVLGSQEQAQLTQFMRIQYLGVELLAEMEDRSRTNPSVGPSRGAGQ